MTNTLRTIIVTGGAGFIGSNFVRTILNKTDLRVVVIDKLTYAGHMSSLEDVAQNGRFYMIKADINDRDAVSAAYRTYQPAYIANFAAETHVDRSIDGPKQFVDTNVTGTFVLLECARQYYGGLAEPGRSAFRFLHVSTDEVYGSLGKDGLFTEETPYAPNSPYSASKAAADHFVRAYDHTYGLPTLITNCSNNYGPYQFPEKLIPLTLLNAIEGKTLPIYGDGGNIRDWLHVEDHCWAIWLALQHGRPGEKYNVGARNERTNLQVVDKICDILNELKPPGDNPALKGKFIKNYKELKTFVKDRPGHDRRYAIDPSKTERELGWKPQYDFDQGLKMTVQWYLSNRKWCDTVQLGQYRRERLGLLPAEKSAS